MLFAFHSSISVNNSYGSALLRSVLYLAHLGTACGPPPVRFETFLSAWKSPGDPVTSWVNDPSQRRMTTSRRNSECLLSYFETCRVISAYSQSGRNRVGHGPAHAHAALVNSSGQIAATVPHRRLNPKRRRDFCSSSRSRACPIHQTRAGPARPRSLPERARAAPYGQTVTTKIPCLQDWAR
jgi:hypothetical protein